MATQLFPEPLNGGLVTARDPALLEAGELTQADDAIYLPNDPAIQKVKARTKYNAVAVVGAATVKGLRYLEFDDTQNGLLLAHTSNKFSLSSFADETGTFGTISELTSVGTGNTLDAVAYNNNYVALIGDTQNTVITSAGTGRKHGLNPITRIPAAGETGAPAFVSGSWNVDLGIGFYHFLQTEVVNDGTGLPIESTFTGTPATTATAFTSSTLTTQAIQITKVTTVNATATKWRVYMAGPTETPTPIPPLNLFRLVGEQDISNTTMIIGTGGATGNFPTANTTVVAGWGSPNNAHTDNGTGARSNTDFSSQIYRTFGFAASGTILGIEVRIKAKVEWNGSQNKPVLFVSLSKDAISAAFPTPSLYINLLDTALGGGIIGTYQTLTLGNPKYLWGTTWSAAEINAANFSVALRYGLQTTITGATNPTVDIDYVQIVVYTNAGTTQQVNLNGTPFRTVAVSVAGITTILGADGPPPVSTTGDIFEGQLVLNDIADSSILRYSIPDRIESFPSIYFLNFESKVQDRVTLVRRLGNKLLVGMAQQIYRINYLPRETDAEFDRGRAYEAISESEGIVGPQAAALFATDGGAPLMAYISHTGPKYTDGFQSFSLSDDLDWDATVRLPVAGAATNYLQNCILVNYAINQQLWLYYTPPGQTTNTKALVFHYGEKKQNGSYRVTGPIAVAAISACTGRIGGNELLLSGQSGGFAYVEDRGYTDAAGGTLAFAIKTREIYTSGVGRTSTVENLFIRHNQNATSTVTVTPYTRFSNAAQATLGAKTFTTAQAGVPKLPFHINHESIQWKLSEEAVVGSAGIRISGIVMDVSGTGLPEPRP